MESTETQTVTGAELLDGLGSTSKVVWAKGNCRDCAHYHNCPRMRGINRCYNMHIVSAAGSVEAQPKADREESPSESDQ